MIEYELGELLNMVKERYGYDIDLLEEEREKNKELVEEVKKLRAENELLNKELNVAAQMRIEMREEIERLKKEFSDAK